jgi:uncharacterized membrane protein
MIFLITLLGLGLRLISLNQSFWLDEATSATVAKNFSFGQIITQFSPGDFHPPLYYLILKVWTLPFGVSEVSTRSFSIVCALISIWLIYVIGKTLKNKFAGYAAAFLLATSPLFIYYSQEARMYVLETLLILIAVYLFIKFLHKVNFVTAIGLSFTLAFLGLTDYLPLLILPVFWLVALLLHKNKQWWLLFISAHLILLLAFIWWSPIFIRQVSVGLGVKSETPLWWQALGSNSFKELMLVPVKFLIGRVSFTNKILYSLVVTGAGAIFIWPLVKLVKKLKDYKLIIVWLVLPILLAYSISFFIPVFSYFRLLFILPAFYMLVSLGTRPRYLIILVALNLIFSMMYLTNPKFQREDWRGASSFITSQSQSQKAEVLFVTDGQMEGYRYYNHSVPSYGPSGFNQSYKLIWLSRYVQPIFDPGDILRQEIETAGYQRQGEYDFNGVVVWKYEMK